MSALRADLGYVGAGLATSIVNILQASVLLVITICLRVRGFHLIQLTAAVVNFAQENMPFMISQPRQSHCVSCNMLLGCHVIHLAVVHAHTTWCETESGCL